MAFYSMLEDKDFLKQVTFFCNSVYDQVIIKGHEDLFLCGHKHECFQVVLVTVCFLFDF